MFFLLVKVYFMMALLIYDIYIKLNDHIYENTSNYLNLLKSKPILSWN